MPEALELLDNSYRLLSAILLAVAMQLRSIELERRALLEGAAGGTEQLRLSASLLFVWALMGFAQQSRRTDPPCGQTLSSLSLTIGLIRLMMLLAPEGAAPSEELLTQPDI